MVDAGGRAIIPPSMPGFGRPCKAARGLAAPWAGEEAPTGPLRWPPRPLSSAATMRSEEHTSELQSRRELVCRLLLEKKNTQTRCWNEMLLPALSDQGIRVLRLAELDDQAREFAEAYCESELDPLLTPVSGDPSHPLP